MDVKYYFSPPVGTDLGTDQNSLTPAECLSHDYDALAFGCGSAAHDTMEFRSPCSHQPISGEL